VTTLPGFEFPDDLNELTLEARDDLTREGELGEMAVVFDLTKSGHVVSLPTTACTNGYDMLVDVRHGKRKGDILKVQVKSLKPSDKNQVTVPLVNRKNSSVSKNERGQTHRYSELVDCIAVYVKGDGELYYIPSDKLAPTGVSEVFLLPGYSGKSNKKRLTKNYRRI
jgi:hypothetical protein